MRGNAPANRYYKHVARAIVDSICGILLDGNGFDRTSEPVGMDHQWLTDGLEITEKQIFGSGFRVNLGGAQGC